MRRRHTTRTAVMICAALGLAAVGTASAAPTGASSAAPSAARRQVRVPVLVDCERHARVRPAGFLLACGDGNSGLVSLRWSDWGTGSARATGVNTVNDCDPYCAAGTFHRYPVVVRLDRPEPWQKHPGGEHFSRVTLTYPGDRPAGFATVTTYPLWD